MMSVEERYLNVKVPKTRIENQKITQHSVNVVLAKTTRNNPFSKFNPQAT